MGAAEKQLQAIANAQENWDIPALSSLKTSAGALVDMMTAITSSIKWEGATADAANAAFVAMRENFSNVETVTGQMIDIIGRANSSRARAVSAVDGLSSATVDPAIVAAARTASAVVFRGITLPADGAINIIEGILGNQREEEAQQAVQVLADELAVERQNLAAAVDGLNEYKPPISDVAPPVIPSRPPIEYGTPGYTPSPINPGGGAPGSGVGLVQIPTGHVGGTPTIFGQPPTISMPPGGTSVDGNVTGSLPGGPTTVFPGGTSHFPGSGHDSGSIGHGGSGTGSGSGGLGAGLIGGGAGAAAIAAKGRLGGGGVRGGITGLNGTNGAGARLGAGGLGGANGVGAGGSARTGGGAGLAGGAGGSGSTGSAGSNGSTAGAGGRLGGGGLLGSQGGAAATGAGNGSTVTSTTTGTASGRGGSGMMGGGAGDDEKDKRVGLGGLMAPKLDDESDAAPRSAGASAGGRSEQPKD